MLITANDIAELIGTRSMQRILGKTFLFNRTEYGDIMFAGNPAPGAVGVFGARPGDRHRRAHAPVRAVLVVGRRLAGGPPIREAADKRCVAAEAAITLLETAASTDPITSRCFLGAT